MELKRGLNTIKNIIFIISIIIAFISIMMLFDNYSALIPITLTLVLLSIQTIFYFCFVFFVQISVSKDSKDIVECGDKIKLGIYVDKAIIYPFKEVQTLLCYKNNYEEKFHDIKLKVELGNGISQYKEIEIPAEMCGYISVQIKYVIIYDMFSLIGIRKKVNQENIEIMVMPEYHPRIISNEDMCRIGFDEEGFADTDEELNDIYEVREFIPGDTLNRIHWKLSAKTDDFMVKDLIDNSDTNIYVFYDLRKSININEMFEKCVSISQSLIESGSTFFIVWPKFEHRKLKYVLRRKKINNKSDLFTGISEIMKLPLCEDSAELNEIMGPIRDNDGSINTIFTL